MKRMIFVSMLSVNVLAFAGIEQFEIIIPRQSPEVVRYAAEELVQWTEKVTGKKMSIADDSKPLPVKAVVLGETRYSAELLGEKSNADILAKIGDDGFRLKQVGDRLVLFGSGKRGALYAVYEFLERFAGIEFLSSWHTIVPKRESIDLPAGLDVTEKPTFKVREPFWYDVREHPQFAARLRANAISWHPPCEKFGIGEFRFGGDLGSCHTFEKLCSAKEHFDRHPEWFSEIKGKRIKDYTQLCLTNPEVLEVVVSNVLAAIRRDPKAKFFGVSQNDWHNGCECAKCRAVDEEEGSKSGTLVRFINAVAERVEKVYPDKVIETLAYQYTRIPPKKTKLRHNVMPCLCTIECEFFHPIPESPHKLTSNFKEIFKGWSAQTEQLYVWDYATNFRHYALPFANIRALQGNLKFFRDNKVQSVFEEGSFQGNHGDMAELKAWLTAKWMWNPDLPLDALLDRFLKGYFGKAAPFARTYLHKFYQTEEKWERDGKHFNTIYIDVKDSCVRDKFLKEATAIWDAAEQAVKGEDKVYGYNVRMARFGVDYVRAMTLTDELKGRIKEGRIRLSESQDTNRRLMERFGAAK